MGLNKSVDFSIAKLLKEKGFESKSPIAEYWDVEGRQFLIETWEDEYDSFHHEDCPHDIIFICAAPTIAEVVMWLYEKHNLWIYLTPTLNSNKDTVMWRVKIIPCGVLNQRSSSAEFLKEIDFDNDWFTGVAEAYEAAIFYVLSNLI